MNACLVYRPDHNGECLTCDEWAEAHTLDALARGEQQANVVATARDWLHVEVVDGVLSRVPPLVIQQLVDEIARLNREQTQVWETVTGQAEDVQARVNLAAVEAMAKANQDQRRKDFEAGWSACDLRTGKEASGQIDQWVTADYAAYLAGET